MPECNIIETSITETRGPDDSIVYVYRADLGENVRNPATALSMARSLGPDPVPAIRTPFAGTLLWVNNVSGIRVKENRNFWDYTVTFGPPPTGEDESQQIENPLLRPPVYGLRYYDEERVVKQARNVQNLGVAFAAGAPFRPAGTLGPIVNGAIFRPDEPIVRTYRTGVIVVTRNYANLGDILDLNEDYQETTNSDPITIGSKTFSARRLKYEVTHEGGKQVENGYTYYPGTTEIGIYKTTNLVLDNVGYHYYDSDAAGRLRRFKDADGNETSEPNNLNYDGTSRSGSEPVQIEYQDLEPVPYAVFFQ